MDEKQIRDELWNLSQRQNISQCCSDAIEAILKSDTEQKQKIERQKAEIDRLQKAVELNAVMRRILPKKHIYVGNLIAAIAEDICEMVDKANDSDGEPRSQEIAGVTKKVRADLVAGWLLTDLMDGIRWEDVPHDEANRCFIPPEKRTLPTIEEMSGFVKNFTEGKSLRDYMDQLSDD